MWSIRNLTPYAAEGSWTRTKDGVHQWLVGVKASFDFSTKGELSLSPVQPEPILAPEYYGEGGLSSLRYDAEVVPPKPTTDIFLNATGYAPRGRPHRDFVVSARVGPVRKSLRVFGERRWRWGIFGRTLTRAKPTIKVPILYEHTYGGFDQRNPNPKKQRMDFRNPIGCSIVRSGNRPGPTVTYAKGRRRAPAGFGAIDSYWAPRSKFNGTYNRAWEKNRKPLLPNDWDARSLLCSPADQQPPNHLRGGEPVELLNLTPEGRLVFQLPKIFLTFSTRLDGKTIEHRSVLSTVIIEPDLHALRLIWTTALECPKDTDYLEETVVNEKQYNP